MTVMKESINDFADTDEGILTYHVSDQVLKAAAGIIGRPSKTATRWRLCCFWL
jgi:hypothetical protein